MMGSHKRSLKHERGKKYYQQTDMDIEESIDIADAGIVILAPYLPRLFSMLSLTENGNFKSVDARMKAIFLMRYAIGKEEEYSRSDLLLYNPLVGMKLNATIVQAVEISDSEKEIVISMLNGVLQNWNKLKNSSIATLREAFLRRNGKLEEKEDKFYLTVEEKDFDVLIDNIPWNFKMIRMPWMEKPIIVKWR